jgi:flagellar biosynthesis protein FliQ
MNIRRFLQKLLALVGVLSLLVAVAFLVRAVYASVTIAAGQVNESTLGYIFAVISGIFGAVLLVLSVVLKARQPAAP